MSWGEYGFKVSDRIRMKDGLGTLGNIVGYVLPTSEEGMGRILIDFDHTNVHYEFAFKATDVLTDHFEKVVE